MSQCPVTGQTVAADAASDGARCPVTGQSAGNSSSTINGSSAPQCPVTGQFADGSRPAPVLSAEQQAEAIRYTLIGIYFSTFSRTLGMGLIELGLPFEHVEAWPHSEKVPLQYSPFGKIPVLLMQHGEKTLGMTETASIARFLDAGPHGLLKFAETDRIKNQKLDEMVGMISDAVFAAVEVGVVKPFLKNASQGVSETALAHLDKTLDILHDRLHGPYIFGMAVTWADIFLYPILADLNATPFASHLTKHDKLQKWLTRMSKRDSARKTLSKTLESKATSSSSSST
jgi:glutathione S-transferase